MKRMLAGGIAGFFLPYAVAMTNIFGDSFGHQTPYETVLSGMASGAVAGAAVGMFSWWRSRQQTTTIANDKR